MPRLTKDPLGPVSEALVAIRGSALSAGERGRLERYLELLLIWNRTHRMTGLQSPGDIVKGLLLDSMLFLAVLPSPPLRLVDIGTGAGIPGIPIRIVEPGFRVALIESRRKPASFLATVKRELDMPDLEILHGRAEDLIAQRPDLKDAFDVAVIRGVATTPGLVAGIKAYLRPGGCLVIAGPPESGEGSRIRNHEEAEWRGVSFPGLAISRRFRVILKQLPFGSQQG